MPYPPVLNRRADRMSKLIRTGPRIAPRSPTARRAVARAQLEWNSLAVRLGIDAPPTAAAPASQPETRATRQKRLEVVLDDVAHGVYRVDAEAVAAHLIARLRQQTRLAQH